MFKNGVGVRLSRGAMESYNYGDGNLRKLESITYCRTGFNCMIKCLHLHFSS